MFGLIGQSARGFKCYVTWNTDKMDIFATDITMELKIEYAKYRIFREKMLNGY